MVIVRPIRLSEDLPHVAALDSSFTTDLIYRVERTELSFTLVPERVETPLRKVFGPVDPEELASMSRVYVAEVDGAFAGLAALKFSAWNRKVVLWHLYVAPVFRGHGVGAALVGASLDYTREAGAWCLWLETQHINYPAVQFYRRMGFRLTGLDEALFDPAGEAAGETALYFAREVPS